jgi:hypothetical protein
VKIKNQIFPENYYNHCQKQKQEQKQKQKRESDIEETESFHFHFSFFFSRESEDWRNYREKARVSEAKRMILCEFLVFRIWEFFERDVVRLERKEKAETTDLRNEWLSLSHRCRD